MCVLEVVEVLEEVSSLSLVQWRRETVKFLVYSELA